MSKAMSVDLGPITSPKLTVSYDKDMGVVCRLAFTVDMSPDNIRRILDAGKTTTLRAEIFTQAPPLLPESEGDQIGFGTVMPEPDHGLDCGKDAPTEVLEAAADIEF
jgi:hypothetical protein